MAMGEGLKRIDNFKRRVGSMQLIDLEPRGIMSDTSLGIFFGHREQELIDICAAHPDLHIISELDTRIVNRYVSGSDFFYLGDGSKDPSLELVLWQLTLDDYQYALEEMKNLPKEEWDDMHEARIFFAQAAVDGANLLQAKTVTGLIAEFGKRSCKN